MHKFYRIQQKYKHNITYYRMWHVNSHFLTVQLKHNITYIRKAFFFFSLSRQDCYSVKIISLSYHSNYMIFYIYYVVLVEFILYCLYHAVNLQTIMKILSASVKGLIVSRGWQKIERDLHSSLISRCPRLPTPNTDANLFDFYYSEKTFI